MAYQGSTNNVYTYGSADFCYAIKAALIAAGWTLVASGGGTGQSYSTSADQVDTLLKWNNSGAWAQLREPLNGANPRREYVFMRGSTATSMIIKYSRQTGFVGGSPGAAVLPTTGVSGDGVVVWASSNLGFGSESSITLPTSGLAVPGVPSTGYVSCIASDVAVNGVFGWWMIAYSTGTGAITSLIYSEGMSASSTPQAPSPDNDPSIRQIATSSFWNVSSISNQNAVSYWQAYGASTKAYIIGGAGWGGWSGVNGAYTIAGTSFPNATTSSLNPYNSKINVYPVLMFPNGNGFNPKGFTSGVGWFNVNQNQLDTFNLTTDEPRIVIAPRVVMPWKKNIVPLV